MVRGQSQAVNIALLAFSPHLCVSTVTHNNSNSEETNDPSAVEDMLKDLPWLTNSPCFLLSFVHSCNVMSCPYSYAPFWLSLLQIFNNLPPSCCDISLLVFFLYSFVAQILNVAGNFSHLCHHLINCCTFKPFHSFTVHCFSSGTEGLF